MVLVSGMRSGQTMVSNAFIDRYLPSANGEYVKIYLMLLRLMGDREQELSVGSLADRLDHTEKDVMRGLHFWERQSLLRLRFAGEELEEIILLDVPEEDGEESDGENQKPEETAEESRTKFREIPGAVSEEAAGAPVRPVTEEETESVIAGHHFNLEVLQENEEFSQIIFLAQTYLMRPLTARDMELFAYLYEELKFPADLLEYLIEYCVDGGHKSSKYIEAVALGWHAEGIRSAKQAKERNRAYTKENKQVMKAFGINGRILGSEEQKMVRTWIHQYGMSLELVVEACNRTMAAIHQPSFEYADKILKSWKKEGIVSIEAAKSASEDFHREKKKAAGQRRNAQAPASGNNRFHNFDQRSTDYDALLMEGIRKNGD